MRVLSLDAAVSVTKWSRRTWWRRFSEGSLARAADDDRGRAMVNWTDVKSQLAIALSSEDLDILFAADEGDLDSQNDIGQLLACAQRYDAALYWIRQAAEKDHPDAMQWLGGMYAAGEGVTRDENMALMWIAKAAALNHTIASQQIKNLLPKK